MKIKKGDLVKIITGAKARKGHVGRVVEIIKETNRVKVEGVAQCKKHLKPQKNSKYPEGGIIEVLGSIHASNVMLMSESLNRPVRTGVSFDENGVKVRVARGKGISGQAL